MEYNKILTHRVFEIDFDNKIAVCKKCKQKIELKDFVYSLLIFCGGLNENNKIKR